MNKISVNPYFLCRRQAHLTQQEAAEKLYLSIRQLSNYETDHCKVSSNLVVRMSEIYEMRELIYEHILYDDVLGEFFKEILKDYRM